MASPAVPGRPRAEHPLVLRYASRSSPPASPPTPAAADAAPGGGAPSNDPVSNHSSSSRREPSEPLVEHQPMLTNRRERGLSGSGSTAHGNLPSPALQRGLFTHATTTSAAAAAAVPGEVPSGPSDASSGTTAPLASASHYHVRVRVAGLNRQLSFTLPKAVPHTAPADEHEPRTTSNVPATGGDLAQGFVAELQRLASSQPEELTSVGRSRFVAYTGAFDPTRWEFALRGAFLRSNTLLDGELREGDVLHAVLNELPQEEQNTRRLRAQTHNTMRSHHPVPRGAVDMTSNNREGGETSGTTRPTGGDWRQLDIQRTWNELRRAMREQQEHEANPSTETGTNLAQRRRRRQRAALASCELWDEERVQAAAVVPTPSSAGDSPPRGEAEMPRRAATAPIPAHTSVAMPQLGAPFIINDSHDPHEGQRVVRLDGGGPNERDGPLPLMASRSAPPRARTVTPVDGATLTVPHAAAMQTARHRATTELFRNGFSLDKLLLLAFVFIPLGPHAVFLAHLNWLGLPPSMATLAWVGLALNWATSLQTLLHSGFVPRVDG